jgi:hypothetical protein
MEISWKGVGRMESNSSITPLNIQAQKARSQENCMSLQVEFTIAARHAAGKDQDTSWF